MYMSSRERQRVWLPLVHVRWCTTNLGHYLGTISSTCAILRVHIQYSSVLIHQFFLSRRSHNRVKESLVVLTAVHCVHFYSCYSLLYCTQHSPFASFSHCTLSYMCITSWVYQLHVTLGYMEYLHAQEALSQHDYVHCIYSEIQTQNSGSCKHNTLYTQSMWAQCKHTWT